MDKEKHKKPSEDKRPGSVKKSKTEQLPIHETITVVAQDVPQGSKFKGYKEFIVQDLIIRSHNICYRMERWETSTGNYVEGKLPATVSSHFSSALISYILYQYYQCHVTQPLLLEQLQEIGVEISSGQINRILVEGHDGFHAEKDDILTTGLEISSYINTDDTGARHNGQNGYCTHVGNDLFAWFKSTGAKSRVNFLKILRAGRTDFHINSDALDYMIAQKLPAAQMELIEEHEQKIFSNDKEWESHLQLLDITQKRHVQIVTEGALVGSVLENGLNRDLVILSDDAGQFNIFLHALCWIHAERTIHKIVPFTVEQRSALESSRNNIWTLYAALKAYKENPSIEKSIKIESQFDDIFQEKTCFMTLNLALNRIYKNKAELLLVLDRPEIPLHNNASESDIREYVKRRKVSGGTRSDFGRRSRDTFTSLKKTCRKLGVSFWEYLNDRIQGSFVIPQLGNLMRQRILRT